MQDIYQTFEFNKVKELILEHSKSEIGKEMISSLSMLKSKEEVIVSLKELSETMDLISRFGNMPLSNSANIIALIEIAKKSGLFSIRDLSLIREDILTSQKVLNYFSKVDMSFPLLSEKTTHFNDLSSLEKEIRRTITTSLTIDDRATPKLKEIRDKLKVLESSINSKVTSLSLSYSSYLSETAVTLRDGHYVLPVKTAYKSKVLGIVYDVSSSGNTTFIEPLEIVQMNNDIASLRVEENQEVRKILKNLTNMVLLQEDEVRENNEIIGILDFLSAKAIFALNNQMHIAKISDKQEIHLYNAKHPLIDPKKVVDNEYHLDEIKRIVIISGPNAGGKTVSLKTVGLLTLMALSGLALPVSEATIGYFNHIYVDIGDNQSLSDNLSTFSAHMSQISEILDVVKGKDLILLDELGTGTDPKEGEALALGCIRYLETKHCLAMISSHFNKVKEYALTSENIENSSLLFDEENLSPTYKYKYSLPGKSYGIEVASRYGIKESVIADAKEELKKDNNESSELINELVKKTEECEKLIKENEIEKAKLAKEASEIENNKKLLASQRAHLLEDVKKEKEALLQDLENEINLLKKELSNKDLKLHEINKIAEKADDLKDEVEFESFNDDIVIDDYVNLPSMGIYGKVTAIKGNKVTLVSDDGITYNVEKNRLQKTEEIRKSSRRNTDNSYLDKIDTSLKLELNIIGMHREEAEEALIKYLDSCKLKNFKTVRIIHGFGNGILRKMVHEYLSKQKDLTFRLGDINEGGGGATVVTFND